MTTTFRRLASGRTIDLAHMPADIDIEVEIAGPLSRIARFAGQAPHIIYSVAEHSCRGADAILVEVDDRALARRAALAFLMHDDHEALSGDLTTPAANLARGLTGYGVDTLIDMARDHISAGIRAALGLPWPLSLDVAAIVADMDRRMFQQEMRMLWPEGDDSYLTAEPVDVLGWREAQPGRVRPWKSAWAACEFMDRFRALQPEAV